MPQIADCKLATPVKNGIFEISREASFQNKRLRKRQFFEIFGDETVPTGKSVMDSYFGSNLQHL